MSCEVAALPFQAHANCGTWLIDFDICGALKVREVIRQNYVAIDIL